MTFPDGGTEGTDGDQPLAPDHFDAYFRPDEAPAGAEPAVEEIVSVEAPAVATPEAKAPAAEPAIDGVAAPAASSDIIDTGRLFRSQGVDGHGETVLALAGSHGGNLRTLERTTLAGQSSQAPAAGAGPTAAGGAEGTAESTQSAPDAGPEVIPVQTYAVPSPSSATADSDEPVAAGRRRSRGAPGLRTSGVYLVVMGVTVLVAFANALLSDGSLTWITGLALLVSSAYAAATVRRDDDIHAVIVPPLAFALAALTAPQVFAGASVHSMLDRAVVWFFALADNWMWIIGSTLAALAIVVVRRYRK